MTTLPIGVQVYSVRDTAEKDFKGTIQALKDMGYDFLELAGLYGLTAGELRAIADEVGIPVFSAHLSLDELLADPEKVIEDYISIGCKYIVISYLPEELRPLTPGFDTVLEEMPKLGKLCAEKGIVLLYHNHDFEFVRLANGEYGLDHLYQTVPADFLQTELDCCWIKVAGEDPVSYVRKYANRCPVVHLKDFYLEGAPKSLNELIGQASGEIEDQGDGYFEFRPVGHGMQDIPAILKAAEESGAHYVVVEQDYSKGRTPMEAVKISLDYLKSL